MVIQDAIRALVERGPLSGPEAAGAPEEIMIGANRSGAPMAQLLQEAKRS